jgi:hypothetical protein
LVAGRRGVVSLGRAHRARHAGPANGFVAAGSAEAAECGRYRLRHDGVVRLIKRVLRAARLAIRHEPVGQTAHDEANPVAKADWVYNGCEHLRPVLEALISTGNSVRPHPNAVGAFRPSQAGMYCPLNRPIDFAVLAKIPVSPVVTFHPDDDSIFCGPCWLPIYGGANQPRTVEAHARFQRRTA